MTATRLCLLFILATITARAEVYHHEKTGILLPENLAGLERGETHTYDNPGSGESVSFQGDGATATVYFYNNDIEDLEEDEDLSFASGGLGQALSALNDAESRGYYADVSYGDKANILGQKDLFSFIWITATYSMVKDSSTGEPIDPIPSQSIAGVGVFAGHFIKLRYTFDIDDGKPERNEVAEEFLEGLVQLVIDTSQRPEVLELLQTYKKDPFSPSGLEARGAIFEFAESSKLINIQISERHIPWHDHDDYPYSGDLLAAFIAGQVESQLNSMVFEPDEEAGMKMMREVYKKLLKASPDAQLDVLDSALRE